MLPRIILDPPYGEVFFDKKKVVRLINLFLKYEYTRPARRSEAILKKRQKQYENSEEWNLLTSEKSTEMKNQKKIEKPQQTDTELQDL